MSRGAPSRLASSTLALLCGFGACAGVAPRSAVDPATQAQDEQRYEGFPDASSQAAYEKALDRLQAGDEAGACALLAELVARCPENVLVMRDYQDASLHLGGEAETAMRSHYEALPDRGDSPMPAFAKARLLSSNFARKAAIDALLKAHPGFSYAWLAQGRVQRGIGRLQEAVASFQSAIGKNPKLLEAHLELAECFAELGRNAEAQAAYDNYLRAAPNDRATVRAYVHLVLYRNDKVGAARPWIEKLLAEDPLDESVRMDLAACEWRSGNAAAALQNYLEVLEQRPENARAALNIGYLHFDAFARNEALRREHWPKARAAFLLFLQTVRPADGHDYFERSFAVPFRLKQIEELLGPAPSTPPSIRDLR